MMQLSLNKKWIDRLLALPESGMGYQRVTVRLRDGRTLDDVVALNAEVLQVPDSTRPFEPTDILGIELSR